MQVSVITGDLLLSQKDDTMSKNITERLAALGITVKVKAQDDGSHKYAGMKLAGYVGVASDPRQTDAVREKAMANVELWIKETLKREPKLEANVDLEATPEQL
jgi:hypothetical protein